MIMWPWVSRKRLEAVKIVNVSLHRCLAARLRDNADLCDVVRLVPAEQIMKCNAAIERGDQLCREAVDRQKHLPIGKAMSSEDVVTCIETLRAAKGAAVAALEKAEALTLTVAD